MFLGHLNLAGQTQDFKIRYSSIQRIFILPKSATPHTLVVVSLDPPIRKGQTYYTHIMCQVRAGMLGRWGPSTPCFDSCSPLAYLLGRGAQ